MTGNDRKMEMETEAVENEEPEEFDEDEESEDLSVVEKIMGVFTSPVSTFQYLSKKPDFWTPFILVSLITIAAAFLVMPVTQPVTEMAAAEEFQKLGMDDAEQALAMNVVRIFIYTISAIGPPIGLAISFLLMCAVIFFISLFQGHDTDFKRLLGVVPWITIVSSIGSLINALMIMGIDITNAADMQNPAVMKPFSLAGILPESLNLPVSLSTLAASIEPFTIWAWILIVFAVEAANRCNRSKAIVITIIYILISLAIGAGLAEAGAAFQPS